MSHPNIFISHVTQERDIALALKKALEDLFPDGDIFVSNPAIVGGSPWFESIKNSLINAHVILVSVSETSQHDPWILFEAGAGLEKHKSIPIIWNTMEYAKLKYPLSGLQARRVDTSIDFKKLLDDIVKLSGLKRAPWNEAVFTHFASSLKSFTPVARRENSPSTISTFISDVKKDYDEEISIMFRKAQDLLNELIEKRMDALRPLFSDIPGKTELRKMEFEEIMALISLVNAFSSGEMLQLTSQFLLRIPLKTEGAILKKKLKKDVEVYISEIKKIARAHNILLSEI